MIDILSEILAGDEGERQFVYDDKTGKDLKPGMTLIGNAAIGIGRDLISHGLSPNEISVLFQNDLRMLEPNCSRNMPYWSKLSSVRKVVVMCMVFQIGLRGYLAFDRMEAALDKEDWAVAASEMVKSRWASQTPGRAARLAAMMRSGLYQS